MSKPNKAAFKRVANNLVSVGVTPFSFGLMQYATQSAWAAGLFEGEGCFTCSKAKHKPRKSDGGISYIIYPCAQIDMTDKDVLDKFARVLGFGKVNGPYQSHRGNRKPTWKWTVINKQAEAVIERFRPFLCERRLRQIDKMLSQCGKFDTIKGATIEAQ